MYSISLQVFKIEIECSYARASDTRLGRQQSYQRDKTKTSQHRTIHMTITTITKCHF